MHEGPEPVALWGNLVTEFLTRDISDGLLRLPWLVFWNYTVWKNIFKRWLHSLESKASYKLTKDKSGELFGFRITELSWRMNSSLQSRKENSRTAQQFLNISLRFSKGNKKRETWHASLFYLLSGGDVNYCLEILEMLQWDKSWK